MNLKKGEVNPTAENASTVPATLQDPENAPAPEAPVAVAMLVAPPSCNHNGVCDFGEVSESCREDCPCVINGICERAAGENSTNCPGDCLVRDTRPCADPEKSVWVTPPLSLMGSGVADGSQENPFHSLTDANAAATGGDHVKDVCVLEGMYPLTATLSPSVSFYGSFYRDASGNIQRRDISQEAGRTSILTVNTRIAALEYDLSRSPQVVFEGFDVKDNGNETSSAPLLNIENSNPILRNNIFERSPSNSGGFGSTVDRVAVKVTSTHGLVEPIFTDNFILVPQNTSPVGTNVGFLITNEAGLAGGIVNATLFHNKIVVENADRASIGILGYSTASNLPLNVYLTKNEIQYGAAIQMQRGAIHHDGAGDGVGVSGSDGGYEGSISGGQSAGVALGVRLNANLAQAVLENQFFTRTGIRENKIRTKAAESSGFSSTGILLVGAQSPTTSNVFNNWVQSGVGKMYSFAINDQGSPVRIHSNTLRVGWSQTAWFDEPCDRGIFGWGACGSADPHGYSAAINLKNGTSGVEITNNILITQPMRGDRYKNVAIASYNPLSSLLRVDFNLFQNGYCADCILHNESPRHGDEEGGDLWLHLSDLARQVPNGVNNRRGDAALMDLAGFDFHLRAESAAKNNGVCSPDVVKDIDGDDRPFDGACDIGADEDDPLHLRR